MNASPTKPADIKLQANNLIYCLLGLTLARWNSEVESGKETDEFNLFLSGSPIEETVRHMGERLHEMGGLRLMMAFVQFFSVDLPAADDGIDRQMTNWARMELNVAWNGIARKSQTSNNFCYI